MMTHNQQMLREAEEDLETNGLQICAIVGYDEDGQLGIKVHPDMSHPQILLMFETIVKLLKEEQKNIN
jgi:hypothetical protein